MFQTTVKIKGMMCDMCESHMNDTIRNRFTVSKVSSSHTKGEIVILSEAPLDAQALEKTIEETGYSFVSCAVVPYERKKAFHLFGRKA